MSQVILIGTTHSIQKDLNRDDFLGFINETITKHKVVSIGEEINPVTTLASNAAKDFKIEYKIIEPNEQEREFLGVKNLAKIENEIIWKFGGLNSSEAIKECEKRKQHSFRLRENEWLKRIRLNQKTPILIICGSSHVEPFSKLLEKNNFDVTVESKCWE